MDRMLLEVFEDNQLVLDIIAILFNIKNKHTLNIDNMTSII